MDRQQTIRRLWVALAIGVWAFALLSLGSFSNEDWPSHQVYPYSPQFHNLCGRAGALVAYGAFFFLGQGCFPALFFTGICLAILLFQNRISEPWLRLGGLILLSVAFAAAIHLIKPGSPSSLPEGYGGLVGIGAASFLKLHFNTFGASLILLLTFFVGLLLAADDLVIRGSAFVGSAVQTIKANTPAINFKFAALPRLPALPGFITRDKALRPARPTRKSAVQEDDTAKPKVLLRNNKADLIERANDLKDLATVMMDEPREDGLSDDELDAAGEANEKPLSKKAARALAKAEAAARAEQEAAAQAAADAKKQQEAPPVAELKKDIIVRLPNSIQARRQSPPPPPKELGEYHLPNWDCLDDAEHGYSAAQEAFVREQAAVLEQALRDFQIDAHVVEIDTGPVITMYEIMLAPGIKVSVITALANDIARSLKAVSVRIVAPVPGKSTVGIEVPNAQKEKVRFKELMQLAPEATRKMVMPLFLGKDASGEPLVTDLAAMPHCLIAGTTGSGKSVCINTIIMSVMYTQRPDVVKLLLIDPKVVEMAPFKDIPHLMCPVINDTGRANSVLEWACEKMDERYELLAEAGVRNIAGFNKLTRDEIMERFKPSSEEEEAKIPKQLPYIIIIIDELADLMMTSGKEVETAIVRLAQKSRAVGIHLILATQRPEAKVVTGLIKSNMPSKIAFRVNTRMDSRIVLDQNGADLLLGQGDMLFLPPGAAKPIRSQGTFIDDKEIKDSVKLVKSLAEAQYEPELVQIKAKLSADGELEKDELFEDAVKVVLETKRGSVSLLQRRLTIGYGRASRLIELMAASGILGEYKGSQARECTITIDEWEQMKAAQHSDAASGMTV